VPLQEVRMPRFPECWDSCGNCRQGDTFILEVLVAPGDRVDFDDNILTLETGKVALDIPSPCAGTVRKVAVSAGDHIDEGALLITVDTD
jgi:pyruvate/2-oxoglutarate dehydrogenase complex dihydrolipoamide acyltransferase (E2) component